jgi:hypothetical protein
MPIFSGAGSTAEKCGHASQPHQCCVGVRAEPGGYVYGTGRRENRRDPDGRYLFEGGDANNFPWLQPDGIPTLGDWFRADGYETHYFGKYVKII